MPVYSRKEFADLCGVKHAYISVNVSRGKIIVSEDGRIDTVKLINKAFLEARQGKASSPTTEIPKEVDKPVKDKANVPTNPDEAAKTIHANNIYSLETERKELDVKKLRQETRLNQIKIEKQSGDVIPTDLVKDLVKQLFKTVTVSFHQGAENFISTIANQTEMSREQQATLRGELIGIVNQSVKESQAEMKFSLENIVNEYMVKRGVGQKG